MCPFSTSICSTLNSLPTGGNFLTMWQKCEISEFPWHFKAYINVVFPANVYIMYCTARVFVCGSTAAIGMQIGTGLQRIKYNIFKPPPPPKNAQRQTDHATPSVIAGLIYVVLCGQATTSIQYQQIYMPKNVHADPVKWAVTFRLSPVWLVTGWRTVQSGRLACVFTPSLMPVTSTRSSFMLSLSLSDLVSTGNKSVFQVSSKSSSFFALYKHEASDLLQWHDFRHCLFQVRTKMLRDQDCSNTTALPRSWLQQHQAAAQQCHSVDT